MRSPRSESIIWFAFRQLVSIAVLPGMVVVVVPIWVAHRYGVSMTVPASPDALGLVLFGSVLVGIGLVLFAACVWQFATRGRGTLAPWDPPRQFVVSGPYRFVRNPMISGVICLLTGEAAILRSIPHAWWVVVFVLINFTYIPLWEEPMLERRFGANYRLYRDAVPRFIPRLRPWQGPSSETSTKKSATP